MGMFKWFLGPEPAPDHLSKKGLSQSLEELNVRAVMNYPLGSEDPAFFDNYLRHHAALIAQLRDRIAALEDSLSKNA